MSTNNDTISVVMPYWQYSPLSEKYLREALQSLEDQIYKKFELILCIDTPQNEKIVSNVKNIVDSFKFKSDVVIRKRGFPNISETRNHALSYVINKWICFLDADNIWNKYWLKYMLKEAKKVFPSGAVYSRASPDKRILEYSDKLLQRETGNHDHAFDIIGKEHYEYYLDSPASPLFGSIFLHNTQLDKIGLFDPELEIYETSLMMLKLFMNYDIHYVKEAFLFTRVWEGAISSRGGHQKLVVCKEKFRFKAKRYYDDITKDIMD